MKRRSGHGGFSLIEVIIIVVIIGAAFSGLSVVFSNTIRQNMSLDLKTQAIFLARMKMSRMKVMGFADVADVSPTPFGGEFARFSWQASVQCVEAADLNTAVSCPSPEEIEYKRIEVAVTGAPMPGSVSLYDLRTRAQ